MLLACCDYELLCSCSYHCWMGEILGNIKYGKRRMPRYDQHRSEAFKYYAEKQREEERKFAHPSISVFHVCMCDRFRFECCGFIKWINDSFVPIVNEINAFAKSACRWASIFVTWRKRVGRNCSENVHPFDPINSTVVVCLIFVIPKSNTNWNLNCGSYQ